MKRRLFHKEVIERFVESKETGDILRAWANGHYSDQELIDKLSRHQMDIDSIEVEIEPEGME